MTAQDRYQPPPIRRMLASLIDGAILLLVALIWWHWSEWAQYTDTFGRRWPATIAKPVMWLIPLTPLWLEAVTGQSPGRAVARLALIASDGGRVSAGRRIARAFLKWSPIVVGPAVSIVDALTRRTFADDFTNDYLLPVCNAAAVTLPTTLARPIWFVGVALRGLNWGVLPLLGQVAPYPLTLIGPRRSIVDRLCGTWVVSSQGGSNSTS